MGSQIRFDNVQTANNFSVDDRITTKENESTLSIITDKHGLFAAGCIDTDKWDNSDPLCLDRLLSLFYLQFENFDSSSKQHLLVNDTLSNGDYQDIYESFIGDCQALDGSYKQDFEDCTTELEISRLSESYQNGITNLVDKYVTSYIDSVIDDLEKIYQQRAKLLHCDQQKEFEALMEVQTLRMKQAQSHSHLQDITPVNINLEELQQIQQTVQKTRDEFLSVSGQIQIDQSFQLSYDSVLQKLRQNFQQSLRALLQAQRQELRVLEMHQKVKRMSYSGEDLESLTAEDTEEYKQLEDIQTKVQLDFTQKCEQIQEIFAKLYEAAPAA